jgi:hypothetical protein
MAVAVLALGASAQAAPLTLGEIEIARKFPVGVPAGTDNRTPLAVKLRRANDQQILEAFKLAVASPVSRGATTSAIVTAAMKYIPQFGPVVAVEGLTKVKGGTLSATAKAIQANAIMSVVVRRSLAGVPGQLVRPADAAARAAAITSAAVNLLKDLPATDTQFSAAIRGAVGGGFLYGLGSKNGAAGAVTGAVAASANVGIAAGDGNADFQLGASADAGDKLVQVILRTAASRAPSRILEIAEAAGYAFAVAYRSTQFNTTQIDVTAFLNNNLADLVTSLKSGLRPAVAARLTTQLSDRVQAGIALAYANVKTNGSTGFAFNNGVLTPVTDTTGL